MLYLYLNIFCVSVSEKLAQRRLTTQGVEHTFPKYQASCPNHFLFTLCSSHGMSYPISGLVKTYKPKDYNVDHSLVVKLGLSLFPYHTLQFSVISHCWALKHIEVTSKCAINVVFCLFVCLFFSSHMACLWCWHPQQCLLSQHRYILSGTWKLQKY